MILTPSLSSPLAPIAVIGAVLLGVYAANFSSDGRSEMIEHLRNFKLGGAGLVRFAWSPDSRMIAFIRKEGIVGVLDIASGGVTDLPTSRGQGLQYLSWSQDGQRLLVGEWSGLRIIDFRSQAVIKNIAAPDDLRFKSAVFSHDRDAVIVEHMADRSQPVLLSQVDVGSGEIRPLARSPYAGLNAAGVFARFSRFGERIFYVILMNRYDKGNAKYPTEFRGSGLPAPHPSCLVYELGINAAPNLLYSVDLTTYSYDTVDLSGKFRPIVSCLYSVTANRVIGVRAIGQNISGRDYRPANDFAFDVVDPNTSARFFQLGNALSSGGASFSIAEVHPTKPWFVTESDSITIWDLNSGAAVERRSSREPMVLAQVSPDGSMLAFVNSEPGISVYLLRSSI